MAPFEVGDYLEPKFSFDDSVAGVSLATCVKELGFSAIALKDFSYALSGERNILKNQLIDKDKQFKIVDGVPIFNAPHAYLGQPIPVISGLAVPIKMFPFRPRIVKEVRAIISDCSGRSDIPYYVAQIRFTEHSPWTTVSVECRNQSVIDVIRYFATCDITKHYKPGSNTIRL